MTACDRLRLEGLELDNLLAFLALLGALRALEKSRPDWHPRAAWDFGSPPLRPEPSPDGAADARRGVCGGGRGAAQLAVGYNSRNLRGRRAPSERPQLCSRDGATALEQAADAANREPRHLWSALMSDAAEKDGKIEAMLLSAGCSARVTSISCTVSPKCRGPRCRRPAAAAPSLWP